MRSNKKGLSHVDWAISLGIFLLYLMWFFVFVKPQFIADESPTQLLESTRESLVENLQWVVEKRPLFVFSNITGEDEGVIVDFPYDLSKFAFSDNRYFTLDEGRLLFLADLTEGANLFWIVSSTKNYSLPSIIEDITATESYTTTANFRADFSSGLLDEIYFNNESKLNSFELYINDIAIDRTDTSFVNSSILGGYKIYTENVEHKCYVLAENSKVYCFVNLGKEKPHDMTIKAELAEFPNYYSNNLDQGNINYGSEGCEGFSSRYVNFYGDDGLSFIFNKDADIEFCYNGGLSFSATVRLNRNVSYIIVAHNGSYSRILDYKLPYYDYEWGIKEEVKGIDTDKAQQLANLSYFELKQSLGYPIAQELKIYFEEEK